MANGGHNPLLVFGPGGPREFPSRGGMLGVRSDLEFPEDRVTLEPGDTFALFTDGLTEARNDTRELFGSQRLVAALHGAEGTPADAALEPPPGRPWTTSATAPRRATTPRCCSAASFPSRIARFSRYRD